MAETIGNKMTLRGCLIKEERIEIGKILCELHVDVKHFIFNFNSKNYFLLFFYPLNQTCLNCSKIFFFLNEHDREIKGQIIKRKLI